MVVSSSVSAVWKLISASVYFREWKAILCVPPLCLCDSIPTRAKYEASISPIAGSSELEWLRTGTVVNA